MRHAPHRLSGGAIAFVIGASSLCGPCLACAPHHRPTLNRRVFLGGLGPVYVIVCHLAISDYRHPQSKPW